MSATDPPPAPSPRYVGEATLARAPRAAAAADVDVALVGVPHDLGVTFRPGGRLAPAVVREGGRYTRRYHDVLDLAPFDVAAIGDVGDVAVDPYDHAASLVEIGRFAAGAAAAGTRLLAVGGDHSTTWPLLRCRTGREPAALVQIDAHADVADSFLGSRLSNACPIRRAIEEGLLDPRRIVQVGLRGGLMARDDLDWAREQGIRMVAMEEWEDRGRAAIVAETLAIVGDAPVYFTLDIDGIDPSEAPGTGFPEAGGLSFRDVQALIRALDGRNVIGADVVEFVPAHDPAGVTLATVTASVFELLCVLARARVRHGPSAG